MDSDDISVTEEDMIIDQLLELNPPDSTEAKIDIWVINLDEIEPGMMLISSIQSEEFLEYAAGSKFKEDLHDLVKMFEEDQSQV